MIVSQAFSGKRYCVLGLARSGMAAVEALLQSGAHVTAWDRQEEPRAAAAALGAELGDPLEIALEGFDSVVVSPGVPLNTHPIAERARAARVPVIGDIELFSMARASLPTHKVVGITGTNGKSTTTALVAHILSDAGIPALMGGNIGLPILAQEPLPEGGVYVLELSSYQIDLTRSLDCDVAVLLNVTPDHLDRYDGFAGYLASKLRLFSMQRGERDAILASSDNGIAEAMQMQTTGALRREWFYGEHAADFAEEQLNWPALQGPHNAQNAWAARRAARALGLSDSQISRGLASYPGLPHRMEIIGKISGILFVNDSKATNPDSTAPALAAWLPSPEPRIHWICGGLPKDDNLDVCLAHIGKVARAYTIGEAGPMFADLLSAHVPTQNCEMMSEALRSAVAHAKSGDVILLSPACASFDQFRDYEARGNAFRDLVGQMSSTIEPGTAT